MVEDSKPPPSGRTGECVMRFVSMMKQKGVTFCFVCVCAVCCVGDWLACVRACSGLALDVPAQLLGFIPQVRSAVGLQRGQGALQLLPALH